MHGLPPDIALRTVDYDAEAARAWHAWLSSEEAARLAAFGAEARRRQFVAGRAAARGLLAEWLGVPPAAVPLVTAPDGSLFVEGTPLAVSLTHAGARAVAAVGERPLGVDLEVIRPRDPALARRILHPDEDALYERLAADHAEAVVLVWTIKEAVLKGLRTGLRRALRSLHVAALEQGRARVVGAGMPAFEVHHGQQDGCYLAVAFPASDEPRPRVLQPPS